MLYTEQNALVVSWLMRSPIVHIDEANLSTDTHKMLTKMLLKLQNMQWRPFKVNVGPH